MRTTTTNTSLTLLRANGSSVSLINDSLSLHLIPALSLPAVYTLPFVLHAHMTFLQGMQQVNLLLEYCDMVVMF